jgi:D-alanyl-D-alanine carboxypeptidase (penicillin-binding protein 5/6)
MHAVSAPMAAVTGAVLVAAILVTSAVTVPAGHADAASMAAATAQRKAPGACPYRIAPVPPVDTSERVAPGLVSPAPLPVPAQPVGGPRMGECGVVLPPNAPPPPAQIGFASWQLTDLDSGAVLAAKDPHGRQRPASLAKMLLGLLVAREVNQHKVITGTQDDANQEGTRVGIGPGGSYPVNLLLHGLLMASGNDIAHAFAMHLGGVEQTVSKMNRLARQIGATDTRVASPSGLDGPGGSTSAYDLSLIFRTAMNNPLFAAAVHTPQIQFPGFKKNKFKPFFVYNDNQLLDSYPGDLGGKTGFTDDAQHTFANAAQQNGHRIALIMMYGTNHLEGMYRNARQLMDYGFQLAAAGTPPVGEVHDPPLAKPASTSGTPAAGRQNATGGAGGSGSTSPWLLLAVVVLVALVIAGILIRRRSRPS